MENLIMEAANSARRSANEACELKLLKQHLNTSWTVRGFLLSHSLTNLPARVMNVTRFKILLFLEFCLIKFFSKTKAGVCVFILGSNSISLFVGKKESREGKKSQFSFSTSPNCFSARWGRLFLPKHVSAHIKRLFWHERQRYENI